MRLFQIICFVQVDNFYSTQLGGNLTYFRIFRIKIAELAPEFDPDVSDYTRSRASQSSFDAGKIF